MLILFAKVTRIKNLVWVPPASMNVMFKELKMELTEQYFKMHAHLIYLRIGITLVF